MDMRTRVITGTQFDALLAASDRILQGAQALQSALHGIGQEQTVAFKTQTVDESESKQDKRKGRKLTEEQKRKMAEGRKRKAEERKREQKAESKAEPETETDSETEDLQWLHRGAIRPIPVPVLGIIKRFPRKGDAVRAALQKKHGERVSVLKLTNGKYAVVSAKAMLNSGAYQLMLNSGAN